MRKVEGEYDKKIVKDFNVYFKTDFRYAFFFSIVSFLMSHVFLSLCLSKCVCA